MENSTDDEIVTAHDDRHRNHEKDDGSGENMGFVVHVGGHSVKRASAIGLFVQSRTKLSLPCHVMQNHLRSKHSVHGVVTPSNERRYGPSESPDPSESDLHHCFGESQWSSVESFDDDVVPITFVS